MVKSSRRRRQDQKKRRSAGAGRERSAAERRLIDQALAEAERRWTRLRDPATPVDEVAALIGDMYDGEPVIPGLALLLGEYRGSPDEVQKVAAALDAAELARSGGPSMAGLTFGALAAGLAGDHARSRTLMDQAFTGADQPESQLWLVNHLVMLGRIADALDLLSEHVADDEYDAVAVDTHENALEEAQRRLAGIDPPDECPCGSGRAWAGCCRPREAAAVAAFADRSGLYSLRAAVAEYLPGSDYEQPVARQVSEWLDTTFTDPWEPAEPDLFERLAIEHAWISAAVDDQSDDEHDCVLTALAADAVTPAPIAAAATTWRDNVRYGLWQVADPTTTPGLRCIELVTGLELYVAFAPEQVEGLPRWAVLLGAVVPLDGAWRAGGGFVRVSPREADGLCEIVDAATELIVAEAAQRRDKRATSRYRRPGRLRDAPPNNVYAYLEDPASAPVADLTSRVTGAVLPRLLEEVERARAAPPGLTNTDGDPLRMIKARIQLRDAAEVMARLADHPDVSIDPGEHGRWSWLGREIPAGQRAAMLAEAQAQLRAQGHPEAAIAGAAEPTRWVRGQVQGGGDVLAVEVNSDQRLRGLLALLDQAGAQPTVLDQSYVDPARDLPWSAGYRPQRGGLAPATEGWERQWLDEPVPALRHRTPRRVAASADWPLLEGLLRQFEYDADLLAQRDDHGVDTAWLRDQLDLPADRFA